MDGETWSYRELVGAARSLAERMAPFRKGAQQPVTAVMAHRHASSYVGVLAARLSGHAFLPIDKGQPPARAAAVLHAANASRIVCNNGAEASLAAILAAARRHGSGWKGEVIRCGDGKPSQEPATEWPPAWRASLEDLAYIMFTSGSSGEPKGVPIANAGMEHYLASVRAVLKAQPGDRFSQTFPLAFDCAVHDLFACWEAGATLIVPSAVELQRPAAYIRRWRLSHWGSVPSLADLIRRQGELTPGAFPSLRFSILCADALPTALAREWASAAPNSQVENWYGPTEATILCTRYVVGDGRIPFDIVPIGRPFPGTGLKILDEQLAPCRDGVVGEIFLSGPQLAKSYLKNPAESRARFVTLPDGTAAYRTGDLGVMEADGNVRFIGRTDSQLKLRGRRVELGPVEAALRKLSPGRNAVALGWPPPPETPTAILGVVEQGEVVERGEAVATEHHAVRRRLAEALPPDLTPAKVFWIDALPRHANGKVDRPALRSWVADRIARQRLDRPRLPLDRPRLPRHAALLLDAVLAHAPHIAREDILDARNLIEAGMDSLAFVALTAEMEDRFGISLDQRAVLELSSMSFDRIARELRGDRGPWASARHFRRQLRDGRDVTIDALRRMLGRPRVLRTPRANRVAQFVRQFPAYLRERGVPDVLAVGKSGVYRAFSPADFEAEAATLGAHVRALNAGFPAIDATDMRQLCEFVAGHCASAGVRVPRVLFEMCLMTISDDPPPGNVRLDRDLMSGNVVSGVRDGTHEDDWSPETGGAWNAPSALIDRRPLWATKRDRAVVDVYQGAIGFDRRASEEWVAGGAALAGVAERMICFVHPLSPDRTPANGTTGSAGAQRVCEFVQQTGRAFAASMFAWHDFELEPSDFLDVNHLHPWGGRQKFSRQLARLLFDGNGDPPST